MRVQLLMPEECCGCLIMGCLCLSGDNVRVNLMEVLNGFIAHVAGRSIEVAALSRRCKSPTANCWACYCHMTL